MESLVLILFWIHLVSLGLGGAAAFGIPVLGSRLPAANEQTRSLLFSLIEGLSKLGKAGIGLLIITGPLMVWLKYGGFGGFSAWFWVKMAFVVILLGLVIYAGINVKNAEKGDVAAAKRAPLVGILALSSFVLVILSAVLTFG